MVRRSLNVSMIPWYQIPFTGNWIPCELTWSNTLIRYCLKIMAYYLTYGFNSSPPSATYTCQRTVRRQAITCTSTGLLSVGSLGTSFSEIWIWILSFSFKRLHLKMWSANMAAILSREDELMHPLCQCCKSSEHLHYGTLLLNCLDKIYFLRTWMIFFPLMKNGKTVLLHSEFIVYHNDVKHNCIMFFLLQPPCQCPPSHRPPAMTFQAPQYHRGAISNASTLRAPRNQGVRSQTELPILKLRVTLNLSIWSRVQRVTCSFIKVCLRLFTLSHHPWSSQYTVVEGIVVQHKWHQPVCLLL